MGSTPDLDTGHDHELELKLHPVAVIAILLVPTVAVVLLLPRPQALDLLAILLFGIAAIYVGFAFSDGQWSSVLIQSTAATVFLVVAALGMWVSPLFLVAGYIGHGLWDYLHHVKIIKMRVVSWYPPFCVAYDWLVAALILFLIR
jgi:hypothetical protein